MNIFRLNNSENLVNEVEEEEMPEETEEEYQTKQAVLKASLPFVHQYGWTKKAIVAGLLLAINFMFMYSMKYERFVKEYIKY